MRSMTGMNVTPRATPDGRTKARRRSIPASRRTDELGVLLAAMSREAAHPSRPTFETLCPTSRRTTKKNTSVEANPLTAASNVSVTPSA